MTSPCLRNYMVQCWCSRVRVHHKLKFRNKTQFWLRIVKNDAFDQHKDCDPRLWFILISIFLKDRHELQYSSVHRFTPFDVQIRMDVIWIKVIMFSVSCPFSTRYRYLHGVKPCSPNLFIYTVHNFRVELHISWYVCTKHNGDMRNTQCFPVIYWCDVLPMCSNKATYACLSSIGAWKISSSIIC